MRAVIYWTIPALAILLIFFAIESFGARWSEIRPKFKRYEDFFYYAVNYLFVMPALTVPVIFAATYWLSRTEHFPVKIIKFNFLADFVLALLLTDFVYYWLHRLLHTKYFWRFHLAHHEPEQYDSLIAARLHPVNFFIISLRYICFVFFNLSPGAITVFHLSTFGWGQFSHMNKPWHLGPLRYVFISPVAHRWHHEKDVSVSHSNFGIMFSIWDRLFGTMYENTSRFPSDPGVANNTPKPLWRQMLDPLNPFY